VTVDLATQYIAEDGIGYPIYMRVGVFVRGLCFLLDLCSVRFGLLV
jgi:hypothetical protein